MSQSLSDPTEELSELGEPGFGPRNPLCEARLLVAVSGTVGGVRNLRCSDLFWYLFSGGGLALHWAHRGPQAARTN
ncbi:MAG: hypothetical protein OXE94_14870 [Aestuariivita sp.]|nr:hypothetical protein [Aestuariivita sp.]MCY4201545.1 hypothetical protein [Aestuariivita sp.]MCY4289012.1 hypothetical protein [Aestuariivita sp.]MCY4347452.1 hypothetical protein [Aestuariivita sp.]